MTGNKKIRFGFKGTAESLSEAVRQYTADKALMYINKMSSDILFDRDSLNQFPGARNLSFSYYGQDRKKQDAFVYASGWELLDLAFQIILYSNDYRGKQIQNDYELAGLIQESTEYNQKKESDYFIKKGIKGPVPDFFLYLWGFMGEQFKFQSMKKCFASAGRELYIIFECGKRLDPNYDVSEVIQSEINMSWKEVVSYLFLAWFVSTNKAEILEIKDSVKWDDGFTYEKYVKLIKHFASTYEDIRKDVKNLGRQQLYCKPYVITQRKQCISINTFLNLFFYEHCVFWILRDYYLEKNSLEFVNFFGICCEEYFRELLDYYLNKADYSKIQEGHHKRADWKVIIDDNLFLIEQKSSLLRLPVKQQLTDVEKLKRFCIKTIVEALEQLQETEKDFNNGKYIKIILLYDDYLDSGILDYVFELPECTVINDGYYWLVTISEIERLLQLSKDDRNEFSLLVQEKIKLEQENSGEGRSITQLLRKRGIISSQYLEQEKVREYTNLAQKTVEEHVEQ